jgi:phosphohistidine swiveling domain-containing protein
VNIKKLKDLSGGSPNWTLTQSLQVLSKNGFSVPETHILTFSTSDFSGDSRDLSEEAELKLFQMIDSQKTYALLPDEPQEKNDYFGSSFRLKQISDITETKQKIRNIFQNAERHEQFSGEQLGAAQSRKQAIVFMQLPQQQFCGFIFTKNPLNGLEEAIVEVTAGTQELQRIAPKQIIFQNCKVKSEKDKVLLSSWNWLEEVRSQSRNIEKIFRKPLFLEWIYYGQKVFWVNVQPLQNLESLHIYSNKIAKDMLPGIIKPLVWSVNAPLNSGSWKQFIDRLIGKNSIDLREMTKQFYYRAYFNMGLFGSFFALFGMPRETLEIMMLGEAHSGNTRMPKMKMDMRVARFLPRFAFLAIRNIDLSKKVGLFIQNQKRHIDSYSKDISNLNEKEALKAIDELFEINKQSAYKVIVVRIVRSFHHTLIRTMLRRKGIDSKIEFSTDDLTDVDAKQSLAALKQKYDALPKEIKKKIDAGLIPLSYEGSRGFLENYEEFKRRFGHLSDSTADMSVPQWRENPNLMASLIRGVQQIPDRKIENSEFPKGLYGFILRSFVKSFVDFEKYSSRLGFLYAYGYAQFRSHFLHIGNLFVAEGRIKKNTDIFYLTLDEIRRTIERGTFETQYSKAIDERKKEIEEYKDVILPEIIFGDEPPPIIRKDAVSKRLNGLPSSKGYYEGPAKIVMGLADIGKLFQGDVLVIPYSDVSWTPLFAKAGAVISESGGILSHCSIIAREYGIPAVVAVEGATRITDNTRVIIDGYTGLIQIIQ